MGRHRNKSEVKRNQNDKNSTVFDDVFRTMLERIPEVMIPLINEVFSTDYPENEPIIQLKNEHFTKSGVSITDCVLSIREKLYHLECQSKPDRTIALRIIEHDMALALQNVKEVSFTDGSEHDYEMVFPHSCVLYLSKTQQQDKTKGNCTHPFSGRYHSYLQYSDYQGAGVHERRTF